MCIRDSVYNEQEFTDLELLLKGEKEWLRDEGMIGELQYSKNEDLLTRVRSIDTCIPVSYTHLDVYKRQIEFAVMKKVTRPPIL